MGTNGYEMNYYFYVPKRFIGKLISVVEINGDEFTGLAENINWNPVVMFKVL